MVKEFRFVLGRRAVIVFLALMVAVVAFLQVPLMDQSLAEYLPLGNHAEVTIPTQSTVEDRFRVEPSKEGLLLSTGSRGIWTHPTITSSTPTARFYHAMAETPSGVLLFGGTLNGTITCSDTWLFNTATNTWGKITGSPSTPTARYNHAMAATPSGVLLFGGWGPSGRLNDTWLFNTATSTWGQITGSSSTPTARYNHAMAATPSGDVLLFGGFGSGYLSDTWLFNTSAKSWSRISSSPSTPTTRYGHAMAATPSGVLLFGGWGPSGRLNDTWLFNTATSTWGQITGSSSTPTARYNHAMAATPSGDVLLFGGYGISERLDDTWLFNTTTNTWGKITSSPSTPTARYGHAMASTPSGDVLLFGGLNVGYLNDTWLFVTPIISVTSPTPDATWAVNQPASIAWASTGVTGACTVDLSRNGGSSWETLTTTTTTQGTYTWTVTGLASTDCLVRIFSSSASGSSGTFTITHAVSVDHLSLSPASATIVAGNTQTYTTTAYDIYANSWDVTSLGSYTIDPSAGGIWTSTNVYNSSKAGTWTITVNCSGKSATAALQVNPAALHHFNWVTISSPQIAGVGFAAHIEARDVCQNVVTSFTGRSADLAGFEGTVLPASIPFTNGVARPTLTITKAMTGTLTLTGDSKEGSVSFTVTPSTLHHLTLTPSQAGILATQTQDYQAEGFDFFNNWRGEVTLATIFTIEAGASGSWSPTNTYHPGNSSNWTVTGANTNDTGSYGTATGTALLTVTATLHLSSPLGGEDWIRSHTYPISWTSTGVTGTTILELSRDNGATWETLTTTTATSGAFLWTVSGTRTSQALVKISGSGQSDQSPTVFRLRDPQIDLLSPVGGELWAIGSLHAITWTSTDLVWGAPTSMNILLARNGIDFTETLTTAVDASSGSWNWTVTDPSTINAKIRLVEADCQDSSPVFFTITSTLFPYIGGTTTLTTSDPWLEISGGSSTGTLWVTPLTPANTSGPDLRSFIRETSKRAALFFDIRQQGLTGTLTIVLHYTPQLGEETFVLYLWNGAEWVSMPGTLDTANHTFTFQVLASDLLGTPFALGGDPVAMPVTSPWALVLLSLSLLGAGGWWFLRRRRLA